MKTFRLIFATMIACAFIGFTTSCSDDDEEDAASPLSPPAWTQGTWVYSFEYGDGFYSNEITVTSNNVIDVMNVDGEKETFDFLKMYKMAGSPKGAVKEEKTETKYIISSLEELDEPDSWYDDFVFEKTDNANEIRINGDIYTKK